MYKRETLTLRLDSLLDLRLKAERDLTHEPTSNFIRRAVVQELNRLADERRKKAEQK